MKVRFGFVSNSSSASFIIDRDCLSDKQMKKIRSHPVYMKKSAVGRQHYSRDPKSWEIDQWEIIEDGGKVIIRNFIDNFNMYGYLVNVVGINPNDIKEVDYYDVLNDYGEQEF